MDRDWNLRAHGSSQRSASWRRHSGSAKDLRRHRGAVWREGRRGHGYKSHLEARIRVSFSSIDEKSEGSFVVCHQASRFGEILDFMQSTRKLGQM
jgi:hypothetical protein